MNKSHAPVVVDLGSVSRRRLKKFKQGLDAELDAEVRDVVAQVRTRLGELAAAKEFVPVVVIYSRKPKKRGSLADLLP